MAWYFFDGGEKEREEKRRKIRGEKIYKSYQVEDSTSFACYIFFDRERDRNERRRDRREGNRDKNNSKKRKKRERKNIHRRNVASTTEPKAGGEGGILKGSQPVPCPPYTLLSFSPRRTEEYTGLGNSEGGAAEGAVQPCRGRV